MEELQKLNFFQWFENQYLKLPKKGRYILEKSLFEKSVSLRRRLLKANHHYYKNDIEISFLEIGNKNNPTLVFLHGFSDHKENFFDVARILSNEFHLIIPDLPGFGESCAGKEAIYSLDNYSQWMGEFLKSLNLSKPVHLMGNSLGGGVSIKLSLDFPELFSSLTLITSAGVYPLEGSSVYDELLYENNLFIFKKEKDIENLFKRIFSKKPFIPFPLKYHLAQLFLDNTDWYQKLIEDLSEGATLNTPKHERVQMSYNDKVSSIKIPTLIVWGKEDSLFPVEVAEILHKNIDNSKLVLLDGIGHVPQVEDPKLFSKCFKDFVKELSLN